MDSCVLLTSNPSCVVSPRGETTHSGVDVNNTHLSMINPLNESSPISCDSLMRGNSQIIQQKSSTAMRKQLLIECLIHPSANYAPTNPKFDDIFRSHYHSTNARSPPLLAMWIFRVFCVVNVLNSLIWQHILCHLLVKFFPVIHFYVIILTVLV